jgi:hypothetical protein
MAIQWTGRIGTGPASGAGAHCRRRWRWPAGCQRGHQGNIDRHGYGHGGELSGYPDKNRFSKPAAYAFKADAKLRTAKVLGGRNADLNEALAAIAEVEKSGVSYAASSEALALLDQYPGDVRREVSYIWELQGTKKLIAWPNKFRGTLHAEDRLADDDVILYRFADLLLLKAKALAALGQSAPALIELNKVRKRAGVADFTFHKGGTINVYELVPNLRGKTTPL